MSTAKTFPCAPNCASQVSVLDASYGACNCHNEYITELLADARDQDRELDRAEHDRDGALETAAALRDSANVLLVDVEKIVASINDSTRKDWGQRIATYVDRTVCKSADLERLQKNSGDLARRCADAQWIETSLPMLD